jgi:chemotaxis protein methyltransferase CheR
VTEKWQQAKAAADLEDWHEALILLAKAEAQDKFQPQVFYLRAIVQLQLDDLPGAHTSLRQALYCDPQFVLAYYTLGELCEKAGDYKSAAQHWKSAQAALADLKPESHLPVDEELTVEMLHGLLAHAMQRAADRVKGAI